MNIIREASFLFPHLSFAPALFQDTERGESPANILTDKGPLPSKLSSMSFWYLNFLSWPLGSNVLERGSWGSSNPKAVSQSPVHGRALGTPGLWQGQNSPVPEMCTLMPLDGPTCVNPGLLRKCTGIIFPLSEFPETLQSLCVVP